VFSVGLYICDVWSNDCMQGASAAGTFEFWGSHVFRPFGEFAH
jgi:hypothetical protein